MESNKPRSFIGGLIMEKKTPEEILNQNEILKVYRLTGKSAANFNPTGGKEMKIIINNKLEKQEESQKRIACPSCTSVLEYTKSDLTYDFWRTEGWTNSNIKYRGFICPCCKYEIGIETLMSS